MTAQQGQPTIATVPGLNPVGRPVPLPNPGGMQPEDLSKLISNLGNYRRPQTVSPLDVTPEQTQAFQNAVNSNGSFGDGFGPDRLMRPSGDIQAVSFGMPQPSPISEMVNAANPNGLPFSGPGGGQPMPPQFRQPGDMGRYVAFNDPGQPGAGFSNYQEYLAAGNSPAIGGLATSLGSTGNSVQPGIGMFPLIGPPLTGTSRPPNIGPLPNPDEGFVPPHKRTPRPPFLTNSVVLPESGFSTVGPGSAPANVQPISSGGGLSRHGVPRTNCSLKAKLWWRRTRRSRKE
jgi:hypothetical protein